MYIINVVHIITVKLAIKINALVAYEVNQIYIAL